MNPRIVAPITLFLLIIAASLYALPRLAVEQAVSCKSCHINPNGGGMRNEFGNYSVALNELCIPQTKGKFILKYKSPRLSESATFGFDSRYLVMEDARVFRMQTDFYLNFEPMKSVYYNLRFGEDPFGKAGIFESYALLEFEDQKYYIKAGKFSPAYGLKIADHKSYIRDRTGHGSNDYLNGLSTGIDLSGFNIAIELFNPNQQGLYSFHILKTGYLEPFGYMAGASYQITEDFATPKFSVPESRSIFGGVSYDRFILMGELDIAGESNDTLISYASLTTRLEYGIYLIGEYNFFDGNRNIKTGTDAYYRISLEIFPIPFVEIRPSYTYYIEGIYKDADDFFVQVHIGY